jgi:hypothetical protein
MENLLTLSPFPQEYDCLRIVSWVKLMVKMQYYFKSKTLKRMVEETGHTIPQCDV